LIIPAYAQEDPPTPEVFEEETIPASAVPSDTPEIWGEDAAPGLTHHTFDRFLGCGASIVCNIRVSRSLPDPQALSQRRCVVQLCSHVAQCWQYRTIHPVETCR
jgi:hypothetical protein